MTRAIAVFSMAILATFAGNVANAQDLVLKNNFAINGAQVTVGDIFDNAGDGANRVLASAPKAGQKLVFSTEALAGRVNNMGFHWKAPKDIKQIVIGQEAAITPTPQIAKQIEVSTNLSEIAVLNRNVAKDEIITFDMIEFIKAPHNVSKEVINDAEILIGSRAKTALSANMPIKQFQIGAPLLVKRGQNVLLVHEIGGLKISMQAKALDDGFKGSKIKAVNLQSNKIIEAIVENDGTARAIGVINTKSANLN